MNIFEATKRRCIEAQLDARDAYVEWRRCLCHGLLDRAAGEQRETAHLADEAMTRLFRLIGTE